MLYYELQMGEGIAGPLSTVGAQTTALYSCVGIAMINEGSDCGGLYHYPAKTIGHNAVNQSIIAMFNHVKPTMIYLTPASKFPGMNMGGSEDDDVEAVEAFLKGIIPGATKIEKGEAKTFANYWRDDKKKVHLNEANEVEPEANRKGLEAVEGEFKAGVRPLGNGAFYFGVNGEEHPEKL